jgi:hypothetical protein
MSTLVLNVNPSSPSTTLSSILDVLTNTVTPLVFSSPTAGPVSLYSTTDPAPPTPVSPVYLSISITNPALSSTLPLNTAQAAQLDTSIRTFIESATGLGEDDLNAIALVSTYAWPSCASLIFHALAACHHVPSCFRTSHHSHDSGCWLRPSQLADLGWLDL